MHVYMIEKFQVIQWSQMKIIKLLLERERKKIVWFKGFLKIKYNLIDHQAQGEKYNSDNSKILDNFSESIGKDFVMYFEIFSIICVPVYL